MMTPTRRAILASLSALALPIQVRAFESSPPSFRTIDGPQLWIAPHGNDRAAGTLDAPLQSLCEAFARPQPIVCCMSGIYAPAAIYGTSKRIIAPFGGVTICAREKLIVNEGGWLEIGRGIMLDGVGIVARVYNGQRPTTMLRECTIVNAYGNALTSQGGESYACGVRIISPQYDGFNYGHGSDGAPCFAVEHDCHVSDAGNVRMFGTVNADGSERDNLNGSSSHGSFVSRYGGLYEGSSGADIADTSLPGPVALSLNYNVRTRGSRLGIGFWFDGENRAAILDGCTAENNRTPLSVTRNARVLQYREAT